MAAEPTTTRLARASTRRPRSPGPDARVKTLESEVKQLRVVARTLAGELVQQGSSRNIRIQQLYKDIVRKKRPTTPMTNTELDQLVSSIKESLATVNEPRGTSFATQRPTIQLRARSTPAVLPAASVEAEPNPTARQGGIAGAMARGEAAKATWVREGSVIAAKALGEAWDMTPQGLGRAAERGELFSLKVNNRLYYPASFLTLEREAVAAVTNALGELSPSEKLVFWMRAHGSLAGKTIAQALEQPANLARVTQLAEAWAAEAGAARAAA